MLLTNNLKESGIYAVTQQIHVKAPVRLFEGKGLAYLINTWKEGDFLKGWLAIFNSTYSPLREGLDDLGSLFGP